MKRDAYEMSLLLDYYGALLTDKQKTYFDLYYNQDYSLGEIAAEEGISRQGVHDAISRAEAVLEQVERAAGCVARAGALRNAMQRITAAASALAQNDNPAVRQRAQEILAAAASVKE